MRKSIIMGLGLSLALAGVAAAQQPGQGRAKHEQGERGMRGGRRGGPDGLLLKGITLTDGQRTQIAQLRKTQRDSMAGTRQRGGKEFEAIRDARQRGDTAAVRAEMAKVRQAMEQQRAQHVAAVRTLLTAEQRVQFDKNVAELTQRESERAQKVGARPGEHGRKFGRGR